MNTEQFDYKVEEEILKTEQSNTERQEESKKIEKRTKKDCQKINTLKRR